METQYSNTMKQSILNIKVSCFENCNGTTPQDVNLLDWLTSDKHRAKVENLRSIQDENLQKVVKKTLPAITPSGVFSYRDEKHLIEPSGFLAFDIDFTDNQHISNFDKLKEQISHVVCVAYCGLSVRGKGFWGLFPIPKSTPAEHKYRFNALSKFFKSYNINLDPSGSDVCRLRIYSWDPEGYFNHNAKLYTGILKPQAKKTIRPAFSDTRERVEAIISQIKENKIDITQSYEDWLKIASALANEFGESGRGYFHAISQYHAKYSISETDRMFDNVLKHNYNKISIGSFFHIADDYDIKAPLQKSENIQKDDNIKVVNQKSDKPFQVAALQKPTPAPIKHGPWDQDLKELERFFNAVPLPTPPVKLNQCTKIIDISKFIESHLAIVKANNGKRVYLPYFERLQELKKYLKHNLN